MGTQKLLAVSVFYACKLVVLVQFDTSAVAVFLVFPCQHMEARRCVLMLSTVALENTGNSHKKDTLLDVISATQSNCFWNKIFPQTNGLSLKSHCNLRWPQCGLVLEALQLSPALLHFYVSVSELLIIKHKLKALLIRLCCSAFSAADRWSPSTLLWSRCREQQQSQRQRDLPFDPQMPPHSTRHSTGLSEVWRFEWGLW